MFRVSSPYTEFYSASSFSSISGDKKGEKLGDMATEETEPAWTIGQRRKEEQWGNVCLTAGFGTTVLAHG